MEEKKFVWLLSQYDLINDEMNFAFTSRNGKKVFMFNRHIKEEDLKEFAKKVLEFVESILGDEQA